MKASLELSCFPALKIAHNQNYSKKIFKKEGFWGWGEDFWKLIVPKFSQYNFQDTVVV